MTGAGIDLVQGKVLSYISRRHPDTLRQLSDNAAVELTYLVHHYFVHLLPLGESGRIPVATRLVI